MRTKHTTKTLTINFFILFSSPHFVFNRLGNLNFPAISLTPDFSINLSEVGNLKNLLLRGGDFFDISERIACF